MYCYSASTYRIYNTNKTHISKAMPAHHKQTTFIPLENPIYNTILNEIIQQQQHEIYDAYYYKDSVTIKISHKTIILSEKEIEIRSTPQEITHTIPYEEYTPEKLLESLKCTTTTTNTPQTNTATPTSEKTKYTAQTDTQSAPPPTPEDTAHPKTN